MRAKERADRWATLTTLGSSLDHDRVRLIQGHNTDRPRASLVYAALVAFANIAAVRSVEAASL